MAPVLNPLQRQTIIFLHKKGLRVTDIGRITGIARKTIYFWIQRLKETGNIAPLNRPPCKRATTAEQDREIQMAHLRNPLRSTTETAAEFNVNQRTIRRRLKEAGLRYKRTTKKSVSPELHEQDEQDESSAHETINKTVNLDEIDTVPVYCYVSEEEEEEAGLSVPENKNCLNKS